MKKKVMKTILLFSFLILISLCNPISPTNHTKDEEIRSNILSYRMNSSDEPIYINHDDNFTDFLFTGNGDENDPYIIEGYTISNSTNHLIEIVNTTKYFQIKNCDLDGVSGNKCGIKLYNVSYGTILGNKIQNCHDGVSLEATNYSIVSNNNIYNMMASGIKVSGMNALRGANNNTILHNTVHNIHGFGINIPEFCLFTNISSNTVFNIMATGIMVWDFSNSSSIFNNTVYSCKGNGIGLSSAYKNEIYDNTFFNNTQNGINLFVSNENEIYNNTIIKSGKYGIQVGGESNIITFNDFVKMNNGSHLAYIEGSNNYISWNYYDGYYRSDIKTTGLYPFYNEPHYAGPGITDQYPVVEPINSANLDYLTIPTIIVPYELVTVTGITSIQWLESYGCSGVTYSLYYSEDEIFWTELASGLTDTSYEWNTTTMPNNPYVLKVIASCPKGEPVEAYSNDWLDIYNEDIPTDTDDNGGISPSWTFLIAVFAVLSVIVAKRFKQK
jgi:parallel beta-helix repeat protein